MAKPNRRATYDDLLDLPEHLVGEIINGELIASPRPASPHARASSAAGSDLFGNFDRPERIDRTGKLAIYARVGVPYAWLINPLVKTLEVLRLDGGEWVVAATFGGEDRARAIPCDAVELELTRWWLEP